MNKLVEELQAEQLKLEGAYNALQKVIELHKNDADPVPPAAVPGPEPAGQASGDVPVKVTEEGADGESTTAD